MFMKPKTELHIVIGKIDGNCFRNYWRARDSGKLNLPPGEISDLLFCHDDNCSSFLGKPCDCDPDIYHNKIKVWPK
jgi:hypothetical protein